MSPQQQITEAIRAAKAKGRPALIAYITAGFPTRAGFLEQLQAVSAAADLVEIGVPFTDPMADGTTIQRSSRAALAQGVSLAWILSELSGQSAAPAARGSGEGRAAHGGARATSSPILLMSYLNPLLAYGLNRLPIDAARAGVAGFIVPDLPLEECAELRAALSAQGLALVQFVTPVTPPQRIELLCRESGGFIYAATMTGTTGKNVAVPQDVLEYFARVQSLSPVPVCAGFGIRSHEQVERLAPHVDGVIVGSALVEVLERGDDPAAFLRSLRA